MKKIAKIILSLILSMLLSFIFFKLYKVTPQGYKFLLSFAGGATSLMLVSLFDTYFDFNNK